MPTILLTGANRGIGLELAKSFAGLSWQVIACCRNPETAGDLQIVASRHPDFIVHHLDVADVGQIIDLAGQLEGTPIDILFNNAGILGPEHQSFGETDVGGWLEAFRINTIAPLRMAEAFVEHVAASKRRIIAAMGSAMGSIADNSSGGYYAYRTSKTAVHMVMKSLAIDLAPRGITTVAFHPGWVRTRMGGSAAPLLPVESAAGLTGVLLGLSTEQSGLLLDYLGQTRPW